MDEYGQFLGKSNIGQIRYFNKPFDMTDFLGIEIIYDINDNDIFGDTGNEFKPYYKTNYWKGTEKRNTFPEKSPVTDIFIDEYDQFKENCLVQLNMEHLNQKTIRDSSGNGNGGVLFGDYAIKKEEPGDPAVRDSFIKVSKLGSSKGAF